MSDDITEETWEVFNLINKRKKTAKIDTYLKGDLDVCMSVFNINSITLK